MCLFIRLTWGMSWFPAGEVARERLDLNCSGCCCCSCHPEPDKRQKMEQNENETMNDQEWPRLHLELNRWGVTAGVATQYLRRPSDGPGWIVFVCNILIFSFSRMDCKHVQEKKQKHYQKGIWSKLHPTFFNSLSQVITEGTISNKMTSNLHLIQITIFTKSIIF